MISSGVEKVIEHLTFTNFIDVTNCIDIVFFIMRKKILENQCEKVLDELKTEGFLSSNSNKKKKEK